MEIVPIFASPNPGLLSAHYVEYAEDELFRIFEQWNDKEYLEDFFEANKEDLQSGFFGEISVEDAVMLTMQYANDLENRILNCENAEHNTPPISLEDLFKPLVDGEISSEFGRSKAKGIEHKSWLRIYAIRVNENFYIISGGAIKLTQTMYEREHTRKELQRLRQVVDFLKEEGIIDENGFEEYFI